MPELLLLSPTNCGIKELELEGARKKIDLCKYFGVWPRRIDATSGSERGSIDGPTATSHTSYRLLLRPVVRAPAILSRGVSGFELHHCYWQPLVTVRAAAPFTAGTPF